MDAALGRPGPRTGRLSWLYLLAWATYLTAYAGVLAASLEVPASWAVMGAVANGLPPALLGWLAIRAGRVVSRASAARRRFVLLHAAGALTFAAASTVGSWLLFRLFHGVETGEWDWSLGQTGPLFWQMLIATLLYVVLAGLGNAAALQERLRVEEAQAARARELVARARLEALRARLDPHFLFNTLHSLLALVRKDPTAAEQGLERFGDLLHYALGAGGERSEEVTLAEERGFVETYLELESLRLASRLAWSGAFQPEALPCRLPALTLQPLVENAVRHAIAPRAAGGRIEIRAAVQGDRLEIEVSDDGPGADPEAVGEGGVGLELVRGRLEAMHGGAAGLEVDTAPGAGFRVRLWLPARSEERPG
ncbi:MAG: histidine kinase [Thermoanaerobaculia bacterium]